MNLPQPIENKPLELLTQGVFTPRRIVEKEWGTEYIVVNNDHYCLKIMHLLPGKHCSQHMHEIKQETFLVQEGWMELKTKLGLINDFDFLGTEHRELSDWKSRILKPGDKFTLPPRTWHVFLNHSTEMCKFIEVSTTDSSKDVVRGKVSGDVESYTS